MLKKNLIIIFVAAVISLLSGRFLLDTIIYTNYSYSITAIERDAKEGYWTSSGRVVWDESYLQAYEEAVSDKQQFIAGNSTAKFLHKCGSSVTGCIIRAIIILIATVLFSFFAISTIKATQILIRHLCYSFRKKYLS